MKIKRLVSFIYTLKTNPIVNATLTGEVLRLFIEIVVRIENIKDLFIEEYDISQTVNEVILHKTTLY